MSEEHCRIIKDRLENPDDFSSERIDGKEKEIMKRRERLRFGLDIERDAIQLEIFSDSN
jgi:hypothetical protein